MPIPSNQTVVLPVALMLLAMSPQASSREVSFEGVWSKEWCEKAQPERECGGFTAYLIQDGDRLCGRFSAARPGLTQVDEGNPRSIRGLLFEKAAVVGVTSGRNEGTYLVRLDREGPNLRWRLREQVEGPDNGDIQLLALDDVLARRDSESDRHELAAVKAECLGD
jgi:hypothetical protein